LWWAIAFVRKRQAALLSLCSSYVKGESLFAGFSWCMA
jgi:hypothetical protein